MEDMPSTMGKTSLPKMKGIAPFLQSGDKKDRKVAKEKDAGKMAGTMKDMPIDTSPLTREEFNNKIDKMGGEYLKKK